MTITCKNCNQHFNGHFCNNCGQTANTHKMNFHFLRHELQQGLLQFDRGILYTSKQLFTRPGNSIREFIEGKRVNHFKPISLIITLATIYGILYHYFNINLLKRDFINSFIEGFNSSIDGSLFLSIDKINEWIGSNYSWTVLLLLPLYAFGSFLAFRQSGYNYVEHLILNAFLTGQRLLLHIAFFPLLYLYNETTTLATISAITDIVCFALMVWGYVQFFRKYSKRKTFFLTLLSYLYFTITFLIALFIVGIGGFIITNG